MQIPRLPASIRHRLGEHAAWILLITAMLGLLVVFTVIAIFLLPQGKP
jgi:hypothetical protein